ncbi:tripartite tricarboxylate transporter TctB family protein [Ramlibacter humi]|uniref:Tripartite tricarboxylate transporter TctB family protein n=1 Tax=Ramlibacter humi TaxID=2530451 RepID=A0A4Z0BJP4_9BURK|nr:tripartite tricarboxylate transporter TctB family protein [Ramlibacter humi]TFY98334.1 tripartite tricarboxylate transporter TctB family protein [Ramlibacter humi]
MSAANDETVDHGDDDAPRPPRSDLKDAVVWIALGVATLVGSVTMDRLQGQNINPYTVPGLLPGLLAIAMILLGGVLAVRSWERGALRQALPAASAALREERMRIGVVAALCIGYGMVLIGHGLPFWLASGLYVTASILIVRRLSRDPVQRQLGPKAWVLAAVIGFAASLTIHLVFQEVFLVRMP